MAFVINSNNERFEVTGPIELKAVKYTHVKSMWSGFGGMASAGVNSLTNKLNQLFSTSQNKVDEQPVDYKAPFKAVEVDTGLGIELAPGEVLQIHTPVSNAAKGIVLACGDLVVESGQIKLYFYNMTTTDTVIDGGEMVAIGVVHQVGEKTAINYIVDNTKPNQYGAWDQSQQTGWGQAQTTPNGYAQDQTPPNWFQPGTRQPNWAEQPIQTQAQHQEFGEIKVESTGINLKKE